MATAAAEHLLIKTMYRYDKYDRRLVQERVQQFREQTERYLRGELTNAQFLPLRLQNGLYIQRLAPMLRVSIPYGMLSSTQLRQLARIARDFDKGYGHISTRQNIQFNWPELEQVPDILAALAQVDMHAIQTSGNCIRNITSDQFAGVAPNEITDPRPWCEIIRQWATFHPEFAFLPRKFKIAVNACEDSDRAAIQAHDIGVQIKRENGRIAMRILAGGGLGRTPVIASVVRETLEPRFLLSYLEAILRVYNQFGRRDNKYKARIKILLKAMGREAFTQRIEQEWSQIRKEVGDSMDLDERAIRDAQRFFPQHDYEEIDEAQARQARAQLDAFALQEPQFGQWASRNLSPHRQCGHAIATIALKTPGIPPGDIDDRQMDAIADLAERYSFGEIRTTREQNLVLGETRLNDAPTLWRELKTLRLAEPTNGTLSNVICCPGGDFCSLANAKSIPLAEALQRQFEDIDYQHDLGDLDINISGCMNACAHHHLGHIGILGVDKKGAEFYQVSIGGSSGIDASIGRILGPSFTRRETLDVIGRLLDLYVEQRVDGERFIDTSRRIGFDAFKERAYGQAN